MKFKLLSAYEIKRDVWDTAISDSMYPLVYGYSWFLDSLGTNWYGIVGGDYDIFMPVFVKTKFNQMYAYFPIFIPKMNVFYKFFPSQQHFDNFFSFIHENFTVIDFILGRVVPYHYSSGIKQKVFSVDLSGKYTEINENFSLRVQNILEQRRRQFLINDKLSVNEVIEYLNQLNYFKSVDDYNILRRLLASAVVRRMVKMYAVYNLKHEIKGLAVYFLSVYTADALFFYADDEISKIILLDSFFRTNDGYILTLNFEMLNEETFILTEFGAKEYFNTHVFFRKNRNFLYFFRQRR